ncbi:hypothetical protein V9L05_05160 [Bernardetia sp. Wsw4-3y2]|uniref:hypothetical protein n=1 Tax=Bernardetia sp. Wsw4-3y2 TaxID=3127471 RepID=UPI0030D49801
MKEPFTLEDEKYFISIHNMNFTPRVWAARNGHRILCGDMRRYTFKDKIFEKWIHEVYEILHTEDLSEVRKEVLTQPEINIIEEEDSF